MKKTYVTMGQGHYHEINGQVFNSNIVAIIPCEDQANGRALAFKIFGPVFFTSYFDNQWKEENMKYFPDGYAVVLPKTIKEARGDIEDATPLSNNK